MNNGLTGLELSLRRRRRIKKIYLIKENGPCLRPKSLDKDDIEIPISDHLGCHFSSAHVPLLVLDDAYLLEACVGSDGVLCSIEECTI